MIREKEIKLLAQHLENVWYAGANTDLEALFEQAVQWADEHPKNPWISVKEKLPPIKTRVLFLDNKGKAWLGKNTISGYAELESDQPEILPPPTVPTCKPIITHWMPIPETPKGDKI